MGAALEVVTGYLTSAAVTAGTYVGLTANSGQSYTIRATQQSQAGDLLAPFGRATSAGYFQVKSPRMHDTTIGTTFLSQASTSAYSGAPFASNDYDDPAWSTDVLTVQYTPIATTTTETEVFCQPVYYPNLSGVAANFMTWEQVKSYVNPALKTGDHYVTWVRPSTAGTLGQIGTGVAINSTNDQFKANHSYALLGGQVSATIAGVLVQGVDTGNLYVGFPGTINPAETRDYFVRMSLAQGFATIPVIQANNKGATFVYAIDSSTTSTALTVQLIWIDLGVLGGIGATV